MSVTFDACLSRPDGVRTPDPWLESYGVSLPLNHVVAYDKYGEPASRAGDFSWNLTAYTSHGARVCLYFDYWSTIGRKEIDESQLTDARIARIRELQFLMCKRMYSSNGGTLSPRSAVVIQFELRRVASFAEQHNLAVRDILERREWLDAFIAQLPDSACDRFSGWLNFLTTLDLDKGLGFQIARSLRLNELKERGKRHRDNLKQHTPLPTRIYSQLITNLDAELIDIEVHKGALLSALHEAIRLHREAKADQTTNHISIAPWVIKRHGLEGYFAKRGYEFKLQSFDGVIGEIYRLCAMQAHAFSGMRDNEGRTLPFHCLDVEKRNGRKHALFVGATTKFNGGRRMRTKWVTTDEDGFRVIRIAQAFAAVIYESMGVTPSDGDVTKDSYPLFISPDYLPWGRNLSGDSGSEQFQPHSLHLSKAPDELKSRLLPIISAEDIAELEDVDPFRAWTEENEFSIGQPWPLTKHQLRRSIALYARASGCVRLSSLRRQLQHLGNEMSAYYGNGCAFAKNFLADDPVEFKKHVAFEWQDSADEAAVLAFVRDVLNSDEPLYGGAGNFYETQRQNGTLLTRVQLEKSIKAGTMNYKISPLGGCTAVSCEKRMGLNFINVACATDNCKNLVGKHSRVIQVIKAKRGMLERIDKSTLTYKAENEELEELEKVELAWRPSNLSAAVSPGARNG